MATSPIPQTDLPSHNSSIANGTHLANRNPFGSIVSLNLPIAIKLNESNFLTWKSQILPLVHGYELGRFLDSSSPETTIRSDTGHIDLNPTYLSWHRQDQLLLGWLRSSLSETLLAHVVSVATTRELWRSLEDYYSSTSIARLHELKRQIQTASKDDSTCSEYLLRLRRTADELAFIGSPLPEEELVSATINGLGVEYNSLVAAVSTARCSGSFSFYDLRGLLLGHEALLKSQATSNASAFYAGGGGGGPNRFRNQSNSNRSRPPSSSSGPLSSPQGTTLTNGSDLDNRPICQFCDKIGHIAKLCYRRYTLDAEWKPNPRFKAYTTQSTSNTQPSKDWVIDSGASTHVTSDLNNLSSFYAYIGSDKLQIGNGIGLTISHIGSAMLSFSDFSIQLKNILYVPNFSTNLISLSKLLHDNTSISINFSSSFCQLKDHHIKTLLFSYLVKMVFTLSM